MGCGAGAGPRGRLGAGLHAASSMPRLRATATAGATVGSRAEEWEECLRVVCCDLACLAVAVGPGARGVRAVWGPERRAGLVQRAEWPAHGGYQREPSGSFPGPADTSARPRALQDQRQRHCRREADRPGRTIARPPAAEDTSRSTAFRRFPVSGSSAASPQSAAPDPPASSCCAARAIRGCGLGFRALPHHAETALPGLSQDQTRHR